MDEAILVTGADGFIGSHLVERLLRDGRRVRAFVYYNSFGSRGWLDRMPSDLAGKLEVYAGDVRDAGCVADAMKGCRSVLHLAALIGIPYSYLAPRSYVETNIAGTLNVVQAAREQGLERVIHTSTSEVYGTPQTVPIAETHPLQGQSPYSATKIGADQLALSYHASFNTPVVVVRPFNTYGPRQSARAVIPTVIGQLAAGTRTIQLGALTTTRDFNFVDDTVSGFVAALDAQGVEGEVINLGTGFEISIGDTAKLIGELMGVDVAIELDARRLRPDNSEVERLVADNSKAQRLLKWAPRYAGRDGLSGGLRKTIEWFLSSGKDDIVKQARTYAV